MLLQTVMSMVSGLGGIVFGSWKAGKAEKARKEEADAQRLHEERLSSSGDLLDYQRQVGVINIKETNVNAKFMVTIWGKTFGWDRTKTEKDAIVSPTQRSIYGMVWLLCITWCLEIGIFAYNAQRVIYQFSPSNAESHWSVAFGFATKDISNPQVIAITLGGVAVAMSQPLIAIVSTFITGVTYRLVRA